MIAYLEFFWYVNIFHTELKLNFNRLFFQLEISLKILNMLQLPLTEPYFYF